MKEHDRYNLLIGRNLTLREAKDIANRVQMDHLAADALYGLIVVILFLVGMSGDAISASVLRLLP